MLSRALALTAWLALAWAPPLAWADAAIATSPGERGGSVHARTDPEPLPRFELDPVLLETGPASLGPVVDLVRVHKAERRLVLLAGGLPLFEYDISLGSEPVGPKRERGDGRTPEGRYWIDWRKVDSDYHRALHISYPNEADRRRAAARGVDPGGSIMIHGLPNGLGLIGAAHTLVDWTDGCIAVTDREIEEIWEWVRDGVPIDILP